MHERISESDLSLFAQRFYVSINKSKQTDLSLTQPPPNVQFLWSVLLILGTSDQDQSSYLRLHLHVVSESESNDDVLA